MITKAQLIKFGMKENKGVEKLVFPMEKIISLPNPEDPDEGTLSIYVTNMHNKSELALSLPDGGLIYLYCKTIDELKAFERCIGSYEPNY